MEELLIWVDEQDHEIGYGTKEQTHREERLHRAFSVFLYNQYSQKLLIHKRAEGKYHSGGLWTNSCCSHPRKGETLENAVIRRLREELGLELDVELQELGSFQYYQKYEDCAEHEIDHVFYLPVIEENITVHPDPEEIAAIQWISIEELKDWLAVKPQEFTAWFQKAFEIILNKAEGIQ